MSELRDQHKAFAEWFLQQNPIAPNVEDMAWAAWKAALAQPENRPCTCHPGDNPPQPCAQRYALTECKALAQPETAAEPVAWLNRYHAAMVTQDRATANAMGFTTPLYAHPPRDEWRSAVHEELFTSCIYSAKHARDPRAAIRDIIDWNVRIALDPAVSSDAQALIDKGRAMRDDWRPASEPREDAMFSRGAVAAIVAGAIYDFAGFMTTRPVSVSIGASDACGPVVDLITSFAEKRGLDLGDAAVQSWNLCIGRDVQPPTESTAKCQRIEGSGQICGLTPPCPDCGPSLIDVPEGS